jgi:hypothetical protein
MLYVFLIQERYSVRLSGRIVYHTHLLPQFLIYPIYGIEPSSLFNRPIPTRLMQSPLIEFVLYLV